MNPRLPGIRTGIAPAALAAFALSCAGLIGGCGLQDAAGSGVDLFPTPLGESIIPLEQETFSNFKYVEFDTAGGLVMRQNLDLHVIPKGTALFGYAFEKATAGHLLTFSEGNGNRDSAGVYIVGTFHGDTLEHYPAPVLWLPQLPKPGVTWSIEPGRDMELISADTAFYTEILFTGFEEETKAPIQDGFQKHHALMFRETYKDTLTYYYFRRGVGCLGFERSARGKLLATGYIQTFSSRSRNGTPYGM
jgi:hypothetical protein